MKIIYDPEVDVLRILFQDTPISESDEDESGIIFDFDDQGNVVGLEVLDASLLSRSNPYVTGWCQLRGEPRWFRVDRIQEIKLLEERFVVDPTFDREAHLESAFQHEVGGIPQGISIWFDPATAPYIRERSWHPTQQIEEHADGSLTLRLVVRGLNEVKRWVLFYGKGAVVRDPPELVGMIKEEIRGMQQRYWEV
jgi:predicted DNA-binding transcriptional regulator YafY